MKVASVSVLLGPSAYSNYDDYYYYYPLASGQHPKNRKAAKSSSTTNLPTNTVHRRDARTTRASRARMDGYAPATMYAC